MPRKSTGETRRRERAKKAKAAIESQETLKEVHTKGHELVRLTRVTYKDVPYAFIDIRFFSRGYDDDGEDFFHPTTRGVQIKEDQFLKLVNQTVLLGLKRMIERSRG